MGTAANSLSQSGETNAQLSGKKRKKGKPRHLSSTKETIRKEKLKKATPQSLGIKKLCVHESDPEQHTEYFEKRTRGAVHHHHHSPHAGHWVEHAGTDPNGPAKTSQTGQALNYHLLRASRNLQPELNQVNADKTKILTFSMGFKQDPEA